MCGSEFAQTYGSKGFNAWEAAAVDLAQSGSIIAWPMKPVTYTCEGSQVSIGVASDYFAVGEPSDYLRLPLSPITAQKIANLFGFLLPTPKLVVETWRAADVKLAPVRATDLSSKQNLGANMNQFVEHSAAVDQQVEGVPFGTLTSGQKKDVVIGNLYKPGKVLIYGWLLSEPPLKDPNPQMAADWRIQPYSNIHGEFYFDYSHGIRFVAPTCTIDGQEYETEKALTDPALAKYLSDEGALKNPRYPGGGAPAPRRIASLLTPNAPGYAAYGLNLVREGKVS